MKGEQKGSISYAKEDRSLEVGTGVGVLPIIPRRTEVLNGELNGRITYVKED